MTLRSFSSFRPVRRPLVALALAVVGLAAGAATPADPGHGIEQALAAAQQDKRGITLYVNGHAIAGAVTRLEPGLWVELKNQTATRIVVRLERIDGVAAP